VTGYSTIVADPPWHYDKAGGYSWREGCPSGETRPMLAYPTMAVEEIAALPIGDMAAPDAHAYIWTTQRYLWDTRMIAEAWGFKVVKILIWCKAPTGFSMGGAYGNASEFAVFCRRGSLKAMTRIPRDWWEWPRKDHSAKPEAFLDMVEQVSPGPYLEIFARRARFGWDYAGDGSLGTVEIPGLRAPGFEEAA
jgi:N6-adenosine-specific RNA methylase IME4